MKSLRVIQLLGGLWAGLLPVAVVGQIDIRPLPQPRHAAEVATRPSQFRPEGDTVRATLPFYDDFATANKPWARRSPSPDMPDTTRWEHRSGAYVNNTFGVRPPSFNVASLDGIDWQGRPYNFQDIFATGDADQLTSRFIDLSALSGANNVVFSFHWQSQGLGERPDPEDALRLDFFTRQGEWRTVWQQNGGLGLTEFAYVPLALVDPAYFHRNFRFRFVVSTRQSGMFDTWNIDYVYLNRDRRTDNEALLDIAASTTPQLLTVGPYSAMPIEQYYSLPQRSIIRDTVNLLVNNLDNRFNVFSYDVIVNELATNRRLTLLTDTSTIIQRQQRQYRIFGATTDPRRDRRLTVPGGQPRLVLETKFRLNTRETDTAVPGVNFRNNDTIESRVVLDNYFAYDDGSAEYGISFSQRFGRLAYRYEMPTAGTLTHIDINFVPLGVNLAGETYNLRVWKNIDVGGSGVRDSVLLIQNAFVSYPDSANRFVRVRLSRSLALSGTFYIGVEQLTDRNLTLGFDRNHNTADRIYFNVTNQWVRNTNPRIQGSIMLRPVFASATITSSEESLLPSPDQVTIYPNPTDGMIRIRGEVSWAKIVDLQGRTLYEKNFERFENQKFFDLSGLPNAVYILQYFGEKGAGTKKIVLAK
jgi:hypothetical protein